jgi:predicted alpha/beta superfamily hydrolase
MTIHSTASAHVHTLAEHFYIPQLHRYRKINIYLPPDYQQSTNHYPVIYMQDGQNLFDAATSFAGEWKVDKTLNALHKKAKKYAAIVVGVHNGGVHRANEYAAWARPRLGGGEGELYAQFFAYTLKPYIDKHFRTLPQAEHNWIVGSSMGGLFALYAALQYGHIFGKMGALSPSLWFSPQIYDLAAQNTNSNSKLYVAGSRTESQYMHQNLQGLYWALKRKGLADDNIRIVLRDRGKHNERFWAAEFKKMYLWLYTEN